MCTMRSVGDGWWEEGVWGVWGVFMCVYLHRVSPDAYYFLGNIYIYGTFLCPTVSFHVNSGSNLPNI